MRTRDMRKTLCARYWWARKKAAHLRARPKSREETPKEGSGTATSAAVPHCNNMPPHRTKNKCLVETFAHILKKRIH
ncbi:hypothetical protein CHELA20_52488 [Hyphomicrobiales bacterium]|nr:hypothetical protein CHELA20_52488 [Hyphomicrobiales bacterium]